MNKRGLKRKKLIEKMEKTVVFELNLVTMQQQSEGDGKEYTSLIITEIWRLSRLGGRLCALL